MPKLKVAILNVGHGDFIYAVTPLGENLVIDCGKGDVDPSAYLKPVSTISEVQISHPHTDHFLDIIGLSQKVIKSFRTYGLDNFKDSTIGWKNSDKTIIAKLREMKSKLSVDNTAVTCNADFAHCVWYPPEVNYSNPNTASMVTGFRYKGFKILFGGDLPESGWKALLEKESSFATWVKNVNVLKVPHHGRKEGCSESLFKAIGTPQLCIISDKPVDDNNENTVMTSWYTSRCSGANIVGLSGQRKVLTTRNDGSVFIEVDEEGTWRVHLNTNWKID